MENEQELKKRIDRERLESDQRAKLQKQQLEREAHLDLLKLNWFFIFLKYKQKIRARNSPEEELKTTARLFYALGDFKQNAQNLFKQIIEQLLLPQQYRTFKPVQPSDYVNNIALNPLDKIYKVRGIVFKIAARTNKLHSKHLNQQFMCLNAIHNISFQKQDVLTPIALFFEYLGFKGIAMCLPPIDQQTMMTGRTKNSYHIYQPNIQLLQSFSSLLNMAPINILPVYLSSTIEVHKIQLEVYNDLQKLIAQESWLSDNKRDSKNQWLLFNNGVFWPRIFKTDYWFRPEFVLSWEKGFGDPQDYYNLADASKKLNSIVVDQIVKKLFDVQVLPIDSQSISQIMHSSGANINLIGLVMKKIAFPHVKQILLIQMIARTAKKLFLLEICDIILNKNCEQPSPMENAGLSQQEIVDRLKVQSKKQILSYYEDFINLMLGRSDHSKVFYQDKIYPFMEKYFGLEPNDYSARYPPEITHGGLAHALLYHLGLEIELKNGIIFFDEPSPFKPQDLKEISASTKYFNLNCLPAKKYCQNFHRFKSDPDKFQLCKSLLSYLILFQKGLCHSKIGLSPVACLLCEKAQLIINESQDEAISLAQQALALLPSLHAQIIKPSCILLKIYSRRANKNICNQYFDKANNCLEFHVGGGHFLHVSLYNTQAFEFTQTIPQKALSLLKQSLFICQKILGPIHRSTAHILKQVASAYLKLGKQINALQYLKQAQIIYQDDKKSALYAQVCMQIAKAQQGIGRTKLAIQYAQKAAKVWTDSNMILKCWQISLEQSQKSDNFQNAMMAISNMQKFLEDKDSPKELFQFLICKTLRLIMGRFNIRLTRIFHKLFVALEEGLNFENIEVSLSYLRNRISEQNISIQKFVKFIISEIIQSIQLIFPNKECYLHLIENLQKSGETKLEKYVHDLQHFFVVLGRIDINYLFSQRISAK